MINISFSELGYLILDLMKRHKVITAIILLLLITCVHRQYHVNRLGKPLKAKAYEIINSLNTWWELPENQGGAGRKPLNDVDFATFYDNIEKYYQINENTRIITPKRPNIHASGCEVDIRVWEGNFGIDIVKDKPNHIRLIGKNATLKGGGLIVSFDIIADISKENSKPRIWISQSFPRPKRR